MNKKYFISIVIFTILLILIILKPVSQKKDIQENNNFSFRDYKNTSYIIDGRSIILTNGFSETEVAPNSAAKIITQYFGNEIKHDLNNDGRDDIVFLLTQEMGGSGQFFYVVAALYTPTGYVGSNAFLLGDRIAPQSINIDEGTTTRGTSRENVIVINFATRKQNEPFTVQPTIEKSVWIKLDPTTMQFGEVSPNFEGESR